jgi:glucose dehydrogenase
LWDYDIGVPPVLFQLRANGEAAPVVSVATKMGWVYLLDRRNGRQLVRSEALVPQQNLFAAPGPEGTFLRPGPQGGSTWAPAAYSPRTGLLYVAALNLPMQLFVGARSPGGAEGRYNFGGGGVALREEQWAVISAVDPRTGAIRWAHRLSGGARFTAALATAGDLVFVTEGKTLRALDAWTGRPRWAYELRHRVEAPPMSYEFGGRQYVAVATMRQLVAFALETR